MEIRIIRDKIALAKLSHMAKEGFEDMVKAVVDVEKQIMAVGGAMHADAESELMKAGSKQDSLWGINIFPQRDADQMIEYESLINIRPRADNRTMEIQDEDLRGKIKEIVARLIAT